MDIKRYVHIARSYIGHGARNGFFHIFAGNTMVQVISALSALLLPAILSRSQYGTFILPDNYIQFVLLFNGLGISTAVLRYCAVFDDPAQKKAYFNFSLKFGILFDLVLICIAGIVLYVLNLNHLYNVTAFEAKLIAGLALTPMLAFSLDAIRNFLRANRENKLYSKISVLFTGTYAAFQVILAFSFQIYGVIPGRYIAYIITIVLGLFMLRTMPLFKEKAVKLRRFEKTGMIKYSLNAMLANCFSLIMPLVETAIVCKFISDVNIRGDFRVSSLLPQSIQYLTMSIIVFVFPYFARNYRDGAWIYKNVKKLYAALSVAMLLIIPLCVIFTPFILKTFYPDYYSKETVHVMRVFWVTFGLNSALRSPTGNLLAAIGEVRFNLINAFVSSILQAALCWFLVEHYQLYGAAYGLLAAYAISSVVGILYLRHYCKKLIKRQRENVPEPEIEDEAV